VFVVLNIVKGNLKFLQLDSVSLSRQIEWQCFIPLHFLYTLCLSFISLLVQIVLSFSTLQIFLELRLFIFLILILPGNEAILTSPSQLADFIGEFYLIQS